jgi:hypothetical protein
MTQSEKQLKYFLVHVETSYTTLSLCPQGDDTTINKEPINMCEVTNKGKLYRFGGISEAFFDNMVSEFDWRQDNVMAKHRI